MKSVKNCVLGLSAILMMTATAPPVFGQAAHVRWDIVHLISGTLTPGGNATAFANNTSHITLTGSGTFVAPGGREGTSSAATGGGTWTTYTPGGAVIATGSYVVTGLVRWRQAPGTAPPVTDTIDDIAELHGGLAVLRVEFSDESHGVLTVSCSLVGTPAAVFEGITVSKGYVDYWNRQAPTGGVDANRTAFHVD